MFTIGKLAGLTSVSNDTLRYYEQEGLIRPTAKSAAGYRLYDQDSARRIHFIKHAQRCGFTLAEIRELRRGSEGVHDYRRARTSGSVDAGTVIHEGRTVL